LESEDERGINQARGYACEIVAWRFVSSLSSRECIDYLLFDLPPDDPEEISSEDAEAGYAHGYSNGHHSHRRTATIERASLLAGPPYRRNRISYDGIHSHFGADHIDTTETMFDQTDEFASAFINLNALEIAAVSGAKKFLSQRVIQRIIGDICKLIASASLFCFSQLLLRTELMIGRGDIIFWETLSVRSEKKAKIYNKK
jgi:hypothetical protein